MGSTVSIDPKQVKKLRDETDSPMMECKKALKEAGGDYEKAKNNLIEQGKARAERLSTKKSEVSAGWLASFVQNGRVAGLVELACNTDFVARNEEFQELARELAIGVVAFEPECLRPDDLPKELVEEEKKKFEKELEGKPPEIQEKILKGKLEKNLYSQKCLLHMTYPKEEIFKGTYGEYVKDKMSKLGENIVVRRFIRMELGR